MKNFKKHTVIILSILLAACSANFLNDDLIDKKVESIENDGINIINHGEDASFMNDYKNSSFSYLNVDLPSSYDLREQGLVTSIKTQGQLGTCWVFSFMSACESSLLKNKNLTLQEYIDLYNEEPDFSEKAFTYYAVINKDEYGEGMVLNDETSIYDLGGDLMITISSVANGVTIYDEDEFPYYNEKGNVDYNGIWTLDQTYRFNTIYNIDNINLLPSPATYENGEYVFNEEALNQIKYEIYNNNAVCIGYYADNTVADLTYEEAKLALWDLIVNDYGYSETEADYYCKFRGGLINLEDLTIDEIIEIGKMRLIINNFDENTYDFNSLSKEDLICLVKSDYIGEDLQKVLDYEKNNINYINADKDNPTYAHYTYDVLTTNHMVTIIGYDDNYSADNFIDGHEPPGDGAFICKNSWGTEWGNDGYFYLSYYDKTLSSPFTVDVVEKEFDYDVLTNDYCQFLDINTSLYDEPVYHANILNIDNDCTIDSLGFITDNCDTTINYSVYLLNDDYTNPTDGSLLINDNYDCYYAGYHKVTLPNEISLNSGDEISVIYTQQVGDQYAFISTYSLSYQFLNDVYYETIEYEYDPEKVYFRYANANIPSGTSYVSYKNKWIDFSEFVADMRNESDMFKYFTFDNLPLKVYVKYE